MNKDKIGYTQGTFDMFHIGHLNLLENAKKLCSYLIVGVNSDGLVRKYKHKSAIIPLAERVRIVEALRCVDEVQICNSLEKELAWKRKEFDLLFIGDDWKGSKRWEETESSMKKLNVMTIYLPYTNTTSSTEIRNRLFENTPGSAEIIKNFQIIKE